MAIMANMTTIKGITTMMATTMMVTAVKMRTITSKKQPVIGRNAAAATR